MDTATQVEGEGLVFLLQEWSGLVSSGVEGWRECASAVL